MTGFCPLTESPTLAGFVNMLYRAKFMPDKSIALLDESAFEMKRLSSHESMEWFFYLRTLDPALDIRHDRNHPAGEVMISRYRVDGFDASTNTVYEYNGCYYHGCPDCMAPDAKHVSGKTMKQLYDDTQKKKAKIISMGYNFVEMWGCRWREMKETDLVCAGVVAELTKRPPLNPRESLRGGRSEAFKLIAAPEGGDHVSYKD